MFTRDQLATLADALHQQVLSAVRQQAAKRAAPMIAEVYKAHETNLKALEAHVLKLIEDAKAAEAAEQTKKK